MRDNALSKLGGTCALLTGVTFIVAAVLYLLLPGEQQNACHCPDRFLASAAFKYLFAVYFRPPLPGGRKVGSWVLTLGSPGIS